MPPNFNNFLPNVGFREFYFVQLTGGNNLNTMFYRKTILKPSITLNYIMKLCRNTVKTRFTQEYFSHALNHLFEDFPAH